MKTQICTVGDDGVGFRFLSTLKINGLQSPYHAFVYKFQFLAHFPFPAKFNIGRIWAIIRYIGKIWDGRQKVKSLIVWDFPDMKKLSITYFFPDKYFLVFPISHIVSLE